jgi:hypothetical protein
MVQWWCWPGPVGYPPGMSCWPVAEENVLVTLHSLKIMEPRPIVFKEWRDTRT